MLRGGRMGCRSPVFLHVPLLYFNVNALFLFDESSASSLWARGGPGPRRGNISPPPFSAVACSQALSFLLAWLVFWAASALQFFSFFLKEEDFIVQVFRALSGR